MMYDVSNLIKNIVKYISSFKFRYTSSRFQRVNECIYVLYPDLLEGNADFIRSQNKLILISQRRIEAEERKQYMWIIM